MLDPFVTLEEAGFALRRSGGVDRLGGWSAELIACLDWARLSELARAIATQAGCELSGSRIMPDGAVLFGMIEEPRSVKARRAIVKTTPWNEWGATPETVQRFAQEVRTARDTRGILIAPAGFSPAALSTAQELRIEAVDAVAPVSYTHLDVYKRQAIEGEGKMRSVELGFEEEGIVAFV